MLSGNNSPCCSAAACALASTTPASTVIVKPTLSISRMRFSRHIETNTSRSASNGVAPPQ
jgi:hypothetical protein